jgi:hypothetical protein
VIDWVQGQALNGNAASQHLAAIFGQSFLIGWAFGDVVEMADDVVVAPGMSSDAVAQARFANDAVEN